MKKGLRFFAVICCAFILFSVCGCSAAKKELKPTDSFFVNDFAGAITQEDEQYILNTGASLAKNEKTFGAQVVVVTVKTVNGADMADYALNLGRSWGVGNKEKNNGIVILLATEDRKIEMAVGYGLEGAMPDSKAGRFLDAYAIPYLKQNDFSKGLRELYTAVVNEVYIEYGVTPENYVPLEEAEEKVGTDETEVIYAWIALFICLVVLSFFFGRRGGGFPGFFFIGGPRFGGGFSGSSRGGFSGGGFRGGGGSFGGGGAGRGF